MELIWKLWIRLLISEPEVMLEFDFLPMSILKVLKKAVDQCKSVKCDREAMAPWKEVDLEEEVE